jgi:O-antigen/teichoic acid export membrane protein
MSKNKYINTFNSFGSLIAGSSAGYFIVLLVSPIITRIYSPEEFGRFAVFGSIVAIFSIVASLSFEFGILGSLRRPLALRFSLAATLLASSILFVGLLASLALSVFGIVDFLLSPSEIVLAFVSCFIAVVTNISINSAIHANQSSVAARGAFLNLSMRSLLQVSFGYLFGGLNSLIYGDVVGRMIGLIAVERGTFRAALNGFFNYQKIIWKHIKGNASYVFYLTPANAIETALVWLIAPLFAIFYDPIVGGIVAMVQRLASAPLTIINQSLGQVFHHYASRMYQKDSMHIITNTLLIALFTLLLLVGMMLFFWFYGEKISVIIFGDQWGGAGYVMFMFLPLYYLYFLSLITNRLLIIMSRTYIKLIASVFHLILLLGVLPFANLLGLDWVGGMTMLVSCLVCSHLLGFVIVLVLIRSYPHPGSFVLDKLFLKRI